MKFDWKQVWFMAWMLFGIWLWYATQDNGEGMGIKDLVWLLLWPVMIVLSALTKIAGDTKESIVYIVSGIIVLIAFAYLNWGHRK